MKTKNFEMVMLISAPHISMMLQAFASVEPVTTNSADSTGSGSNISALLREYYQRAFLESAKANLVHELFGTKYQIPKKRGQTLNMRRMEHLPDVTEPLTEGVTPDSGILRVSEVTCGFEQFGYYIPISDVVDLTVEDEYLTEMVEELGYQGANRRDKYVRNKMLGTLNKMYAPKSDGTAVTAKDNLDTTCKLTVKLVRDAATKMKANNVKPLEDGLYVMIVHPYVVADLKNDPEFKDWTAYTSAGVKRMYTGEIGYMEGVRFVESTNALVERVGTTTQNSVYHCFTVGRGGYGVTDVEGGGLETIIKGYGEGDDPLNQRMTAGWKTLVGAKVLSDEALLDLCVCSSKNDTPAN